MSRKNTPSTPSICHPRLYFKAATLLGPQLLPFLGKITHHLVARISAAQDKQVVEGAAQAIGGVVEQLLAEEHDSLKTEEVVFTVLKNILDPLFTSTRALTQQGMAIALAKVIQSVPLSSLSIY